MGSLGNTTVTFLPPEEVLQRLCADNRPAAPVSGEQPLVSRLRRPSSQLLMKASRSGLITSACVVHMPCGNFS